ncbi:MAG: hypothetical protein V1809_15820 [Planctomycetota bacterium]
MNTRARSGENGMALITACIAIVIIAGFSVAFLWRSSRQNQGVSTQQKLTEALYVAETGISKALNELNKTTDFDGGGRGNVTGSYGGGSYSATATDLGSGLSYRINATGTYQQYSRTVEVVVNLTTTPLVTEGIAAVTSLAPVTTGGTCEIDGRDWNYNNTALVGAGVYGVVSGGAIAVGGSSTLGGNGTVPATSLNVNNGQENHVWPTGYPAGPDQSLDLPVGTLKTAAQTAGTYFASEAAFNTYITTNGGVCPGGKIIYVECAQLLPMEIGSALNDPPSIFVLHNATGNAIAKNIHGNFRGLMLIDSIDHTNAGTNIVGAMQTFGPSAVGNAFGNGGSVIRFSSAVLARLPGVAMAGANFTVVAWQEK